MTWPWPDQSRAANPADASNPPPPEPAAPPERDTSPHLYPEAVLAASETLRTIVEAEPFTRFDNNRGILSHVGADGTTLLTFGHLRTLLGHLDHMGYLERLGETDAPTEPVPDLQRDPDAASVPDPDALLTEAEEDAVRDLGAWWGRLCGIVGDGPTRDADLFEAVAHVHALQHTIMAQAAARAMPDAYRLLGGTVRGAEAKPPAWTDPVRCLDVSCAHRADPAALHTCYKRPRDLAAREERGAYVKRTPADNGEPPMGIDVMASCVHDPERRRWRQVEPGLWCPVADDGLTIVARDNPDDWASLTLTVRCQA